MDKADGAFLTIGELARELGVAQHILRYWETRFSQLKPLQRSGNRRYYRPADVAVARRINRLLNEEGFTVRGAQRVLSGQGESLPADAPVPAETALPAGAASPASAPVPAPALATPAPMALPPAANGSVSGQSASGLGVSGQTELALGDQPMPRRARGQFDSSDVALLIARLTVIRENLREAIEAR